MAQPDEYNRQFSFTQRTVDKPFDPMPGDQLDSEFDAIKTTLDQTRNNIALLQRDDGQQQNRSVGLDQLTSAATTALGLLSPATVKEFIFDISSGGVVSLSGADRNGNTLAYVAAATGIVGSEITMYEAGNVIDPALFTHTDGTSISYPTGFTNPSFVIVHIQEAQFVPTTDIELLDDISSGFNGVLTTFAMTVNAIARVVNLEARLDVYIDFQDTHGYTIRQPLTDFTVSGSNITFATPPPATTI